MLVVGHCLEVGGAQIPYAPLVGALRPVARGGGLGRLGPADARDAPPLAEILPDLAVAGVAAGDGERLATANGPNQP